MPNTRLKQAVREAYASSPADVVVLNTLEIRHPLFDAPIYLVNNYRNFSANLETGEHVTFRSYSFGLGLPEDGEKPSVSVSLKIENVSREMVNLIEGVVESAEPITIVYRPYLSDEPQAPQYDPPLEMQLSGIVATTDTITAKATFGELANIKFPNRIYDIEEFPQLVWR